jgi:glycosyltransferase involved in cell wall biosynthesis
VIDNGSSDESRHILDTYASRLPLTSLQEPRLGKNVALNAGLKHVAGDLAVFTDDDVYPFPDWLVSLRRAADAHPAYTIFGGTVLPRWESPPPAWVLDWVPVAPTFTLTGELPDGPTTAHTVFGPNMAVRQSVFAAGARFDQGIGPRGVSYAMGSETELVRRLMADGHQSWHVAAARVEHFIRAEQLELVWILRRAVSFGRGQYRMDPDRSAPRWAGVPRWLVGELGRQGLALAGRTVAGDAKGAFRARWELAFRWGQLLEARAAAGGGR